MGRWSRSCCAKSVWQSSKAKLVSNDMLLSPYSIGRGVTVLDDFLNYHVDLFCGVLVFLAAKSGLIKDTEEAAEFQNFIICVEMLIAALGHLYAFPYKEYAGANIGVNRGFTASLAHALKLNDFYHDTVHQFAPTYHDYVLYNHGEGDDGTRKYRARTFVPTGPEMDAVRRNKHMFGNKSDDMQSSSLSSSVGGTPRNSDGTKDTVKTEAMNSSLLRDASNSVSVPYDLSLIDIDLSRYPTKVGAANEAGTR
ncbi:UNVERIFIED_CONTAM: hypothetical protein Scaly_2697600 [Sesamum calycinum]|uniref:Uncharacterized protein n=1 Tax=Sesamum calycinum TaxID=2727403 RepID=A0AAW2J5A7_9LAMI